MDIPIELALENEVLAASLELGMKGDPGADGAPGKDGITPTIGENGNWYYGSEDSGKPSRGLTGPTGPKGEKGDKGEAGPTGPAGQSGEPGAAGTTFTPAVSDSGVLSWTNDGGKENPASVSIKGPQGEPGQTGPTGPQGPQGETGPRGPQGEQGPTGPAGSDASVTAANIAAALGYTPLGASDLLDAIYPVGSIYQSVNSTSPATLFGGTWERIEDKFLLAAGSTYAAGSTGGEASVSLTAAQNGPHTHAAYYADSSGSKSFGYSYTNKGEQSNASTDSSGIASSGSGQPHNNMPPYLAVYAWQRTA